MEEQRRQGDILLIQVPGLPARVIPVPRDPVRGVVLAYGEATGHAHTISSPRARLFRLDEGKAGSAREDRYLAIGGFAPVALAHQEHHSIDLPPGHYRVVRQKVYAPGAVPRYVAD
jgi:hypothetical protein